MDIHREIVPCRGYVRAVQAEGRTVGLVPTMGALHEGHLSLIHESLRRCDVTAVSIFVNPTQFGPGEDFAQYPRTLDGDLDACRSCGVSLVFVPDTSTMYPNGSATTVHVVGITEGLCGSHRLGHFDGVTTIVAKLFNVLPADVAFFGEKDYQQLLVIRKMVANLNFPIEIVGCPIVRESDGLAMSSRNRYLSPLERQQALSLSRALLEAKRSVEDGVSDCGDIVRGMEATMAESGGVTVDYIEIVDAETLVRLRRVDRAARICLAVRVGSCRLIDNIAVDPSGDTA